MNSYMLSESTLKHGASSKTITNIVIRYIPIHHMHQDPGWPIGGL